MKSGKTSKADQILDLMRFAKAIESYGNDFWSQVELAERLKVTTRTVTRYMQLLKAKYGLRISIKPGADKCCSVIGSWSFMDQLKKQYQGVK